MWRQLVIAAITPALLSGCVSTRFGARLCTVTLDSCSQIEDAYLIPNDHYLELIEEGKALTLRRLANYYRGKTPVTVRILPYEWVYLVKDSTGKISKPVTFNPNKYMDGHVAADDQ